MEILEKLFGGAAKVKVMKLFLFNPEDAFDVSEAALRAKVSRAVARKEISNLLKINFLHSHGYLKEVKRQRGRTMNVVKKRVNGWILDQKFPYLEPLETFLSEVHPFRHKDMVRKISRAGKIELLVISGFFIKYDEARADLLIVGDRLKMGILENIIKTIESEIGKEIRYAVFDTPEFNYRLSIFDKLIRDILDYPHQKIINKLGL